MPSVWLLMRQMTDDKVWVPVSLHSTREDAVAAMPAGTKPHPLEAQRPQRWVQRPQRWVSPVGNPWYADELAVSEWPVQPATSTPPQQERPYTQWTVQECLDAAATASVAYLGTVDYMAMAQVLATQELTAAVRNLTEPPPPVLAEVDCTLRADLLEAIAVGRDHDCSAYDMTNLERLVREHAERH